MLLNYLKIALRNFARHKGYSFINVAGLAVGMAACLFIMLYVQDEISYDQYHAKADRLYRINLHARLAGNDIATANTCAPMAAALKSEYPEVETVVRLDKLSQPILVSNGNDRFFNEHKVLFADSTFFEAFSIKVLAGEARTALREPYSVVLTKETARKYFGDQNAVGKTLTFDNKDSYNVTAVTENVPGNTHFDFDLLASFTSMPWHAHTIWVQNNIHTYVVLRQGASVAEFGAKLKGLVRKYVGPQIQQTLGVSLADFFANGGDYRYEPEKVTDIHLYSSVLDNPSPGGDPTYVAIFSIIAMFIMIIACVNFMNLATARSANRAREVGVRKVVGSNRMQLVRQFLAEAVMLSLIAMLFAILLVKVFMPHFNALTGKELTINFIGDPVLFAELLGITLLIGCLAGWYPALMLAGFRPVEVLKGRFSGGAGHALMRRGLVVFQFAITIVLLISTFVVSEQLQYVRSKNLGFDKEHVLLVKRARALGDHLDSFQQRLRQHPDVITTAGTWHLPGTSLDQNGFKPEDFPTDNGLIVSTFSVGYDFVETLGIEMVAGRSFSREFGADSSAYVINETAVRRFGWDDAIGKTIYEPDPEAGLSAGKVIGVVKNFHYNSLREQIAPAIMRLRPWARLVAVRITGNNIQDTIKQIKETWDRYAPEQPFEYSFLDDDFDNLYQADQRVGKIFAVFSGLGIVIACLGLFGLASFSAQQRTKEIGVRKTLGASTPGIFLLLSKEFTKLVAIAFIIAVPIGIWAMQQWLQGFAYKTALSVDIFLTAGLLAMGIAWLTVSYQSIKASLTNPARALKYE